MNIGLTIEAIDNLITGLQKLKTYQYKEQADFYNQAMNTGTVQLINTDYKITLYKLPPISKPKSEDDFEGVDLMEDE